MTSKRLGSGILTVSKIKAASSRTYLSGFVNTHKGLAVIAAEESDQTNIRIASYPWNGYGKVEMGQTELLRSPKYDGRYRVAVYVGELEIYSFPFRIEIFRRWAECRGNYYSIKLR